jgi:thiol:disulfide interchange protein
MKKLILGCLAAVLLGANVQAQALIGIRFFEGTFEQALEQAGKEQKPIFMDAYATWCGPCKAMSRNVFPNKAVGDFYNANFINLKVDWESGAARKLHSRFPIHAFPTLLFVGTDGKLAYKSEGYHDAQELVKLGQAVLQRMKK